MVALRLRAADVAGRLATLALAGGIVAWAANMSTRLGPTYDEPADITAGYVLWRAGEGLAPSGRPPLALMLESLGLWVTWGAGVSDWPGLAEGDLDRLTAHVLGGEIPVMHMLWWARIPSLLATFLTVLLVHRGARVLWGQQRAALLAAAAYALAPSTLAHATRADGAALAALFLVGATLAGWRWLRAQRLGRLALGCALAGLLTDWTLWILIPFAGAVLLAEGMERVIQQGRRENRSRWALLRERVAAALRRSRRLAVRVILGLVIFWLVMIELTGNWALWQDLWHSAVIHWRGRPAGAFPLYFHGHFSEGRPLLYQPVLLVLKTPLWLVALWLIAVVFALPAVRHRTTETRPLRALVYLHAGLLCVVVAGTLIFPARGYEIWTPLIPLVCIVAGGAIAAVPSTSPATDRLRRATRVAARWAAAVLALGIAVVGDLRGAPFWYPRFNSLAAVTGGPRAWFAAPELDAGPAMPAVEEYLDETDQVHRLLFVAHCGRWSPAALGLRCLFLPSHGLLGQATQGFDQRHPPPGLYVIASSLLVGQDLFDPDTYKWFREHPPEKWIGGGVVGIWKVSR